MIKVVSKVVLITIVEALINKGYSIMIELSYSNGKLDHYEIDII